MITMDYCDLFEEPQSILELVNKKFGKSYAEMTCWQLGFLCGLIKKYRPGKILELGISAGGTSAVVMNALTLLELEAEYYAVDISKDYYLDASQRTGFVAEWAFNYLKGAKEVKWSYKPNTGHGVTYYLEDVGKGIDFLILDTMHLCPGEILDFLACFPFLSNDAIVVMHDIAMHFESNRNAYATQLLFDTVVADKILGRDDSDNKHGYPNIGAFKLKQATTEYLENVFSALNIPWQYIPEEIGQYRDWYKKHYEPKMISTFDMACSNNREEVAKEEEAMNDELVLCQ